MVKTNGISIEGDIIQEFVPSKIDLFISSISWEERDPIGWNLLQKKGIKPEKKIVFFYDEVLKLEEGTDDTRKINDNIVYFKKIFNITRDEEICSGKMSNEAEGLKKFQDFIDSNYSDASNISIVFDFSVMVKPYFFILLNFLCNYKGIRKIYLLYTEPKVYNVKKTAVEKDQKISQFTRGSDGPPKEMLSFSGNRVGSKSEALIILLGFEGLRSKEVINEINPDITIPINGFPGYRPEFKDMSILLNDEILKEGYVFKSLRYAPSNDPFETKKEIENIFFEKQSRYNIAIAPLGPKPMALGCCLFVLEHPECRIIYPYPREYNQKASKEFGKTWLYLIEFEY